MLARSIRAGMDGINPADLSQYGKAIVFDPQDLRTLYQDAAGTTPVTGVEQFVGLMLDKGQGLTRSNVHTSNFYSGVDGYVSGLGSIESVDGALQLTTSVANGYAFKDVVTVINKWYVLKAKVRRVSGTGSFQLKAAASPFTNFVASPLISSNTFDEFTVYYFATTTSTRVYIQQNSSGSVPSVIQVKDITLESIDGHHATQSTAGSRPTLSARYNMLVGTDTLATQSVATLATDYTLSFSGTGTVTLSGTATGAKSAGTNTFTATAGTLTLTVSGTVTNAQLVASNQSSLPYQSVTSATVYDSDPTKFPYYLNFTNHWMVTPSIDATAWDKVMVACGLRKMSDAARGTVIESSATIASNNGAFALTAPRAAEESIGMESKGTALTDAIAPTLTAPITKAVAALASIGADSNMIRINGASADTDSGDQGTGNLGNYPLYIGKRAGTSLPFNGYLYGLTVLFPTALPNDNIIKALERHYAAKAGIRL